MAGIWLALRVRREALQRRQRERGGLAGAGLCTRHEIAAREDERDGLFLDRAWIFVAQVFNRLQQRRDQAQFFET